MSDSNSVEGGLLIMSKLVLRKCRHLRDALLSVMMNQVHPLRQIEAITFHFIISILLGCIRGLHISLLCIIALALP